MTPTEIAPLSEDTPVQKAIVRIDGHTYVLHVTVNTDGTLTVHKTSDYAQFARALGYTPSISIGERVRRQISSYKAQSN